MPGLYSGIGSQQPQTPQYQQYQAAQGGSAYNPMQPTYYNNPIDPSQSLALAEQSFQPMDVQANRALQSQLAAAGIQGGAAVNAGEELQAQLVGAQSPALMQALQFAQGLNQQQGLFNAGEATNAGQMIAQALQNQYFQGMGMFGGLNEQALGGYQNLASSNLGNFPIQQGAGEGLMNLGAAIGQYGQQPSYNYNFYGNPQQPSQPGSPNYNDVMNFYGYT